MDYLIDWIAEHSIAIMAVLVMAIALLLFLLVFDKIRRWSRARRAARPPAWAVRPERPLKRADEPSTPVPTPSSRVCAWDNEIVPYVDGDLDGYRLECFEGHLRDCDFCKSEVERIGALRHSYEPTRECRWGIEVLKLYGSAPKGPWVLDVERHLATCASCRVAERVLRERARSNPEVVDLEQAYAAPAREGRTP